MKKSLGFGNVRAASSEGTTVSETLHAAAQMKPRPLGDDVPSMEQVERAVEAQAETIRQTPISISRKRPSKGIAQPLNMRVRIATYNRFVELSKELRLPYDETLEVLLKAAGIDEQGRASKPLI